MRYFLFLVLLALVGCGGSEEEAGCMDAIDNFYFQGCTLGRMETLTRYEAQDLCFEVKDTMHYKSPECDDDAQRWVDCLASVDRGECTKCNRLIDALLTCY